jgi:hypothetical protein
VAIGIAVANGIEPGAPLDFSDAAQLLAAGDVTPAVLGLALATISPSLGLPLGLGLPRALGWVLLALGVGVGLVAYPAQYFRVAGASLVVLPAMMVFFLWLIAMGVTLLRWRPACDGMHLAARQMSA